MVKLTLPRSMLGRSSELLWAMFCQSSNWKFGSRDGARAGFWMAKTTGNTADGA